MGSRTITLDDEAYKRLKREKSANESSPDGKFNLVLKLSESEISLTGSDYYGQSIQETIATPTQDLIISYTSSINFLTSLAQKIASLTLESARTLPALSIQTLPSYRIQTGKVTISPISTSEDVADLVMSESFVTFDDSKKTYFRVSYDFPTGVANALLCLRPDRFIERFRFYKTGSYYDYLLRH